MRLRPDLVRLLGVALVTLVADQASKAVVRATIGRGSVVDLPGPIDLTLGYNDGIAFGVASGVGPLVVLFSLVALAALAWFINSAPPGWLTSIAGGLILGGALGNLIDRIHEGAVTDFILLPFWPTFNLADLAITAGVLLLAINILRSSGDDGG